MNQPQALAPFGEAQPRFGEKQPLDRTRTGACLTRQFCQEAIRINKLVGNGFI